MTSNIYLEFFWKNHLFLNTESPLTQTRDNFKELCWQNQCAPNTPQALQPGPARRFPVTLVGALSRAASLRQWGQQRLQSHTTSNHTDIGWRRNEFWKSGDYQKTGACSCIPFSSSLCMGPWKVDGPPCQELNVEVDKHFQQWSFSFSSSGLDISILSTTTTMKFSVEEWATSLERMVEGILYFSHDWFLIESWWHWQIKIKSFDTVTLPQLFDPKRQKSRQILWIVFWNTFTRTCVQVRGLWGCLRWTKSSTPWNWRRLRQCGDHQNLRQKLCDRVGSGADRQSQGPVHIQALSCEGRPSRGNTEVSGQAPPHSVGWRRGIPDIGTKKQVSAAKKSKTSSRFDLSTMRAPVDLDFCKFLGQL